MPKCCGPSWRVRPSTALRTEFSQNLHRSLARSIEHFAAESRKATTPEFSPLRHSMSTLNHDVAQPLHWGATILCMERRRTRQPLRSRWSATPRILAGWRVRCVFSAAFEPGLSWTRRWLFETRQPPAPQGNSASLLPRSATPENCPRDTRSRHDRPRCIFRRTDFRPHPRSGVLSATSTRR